MSAPAVRLNSSCRRRRLVAAVVVVATVSLSAVGATAVGAFAASQSQRAQALTVYAFPIGGPFIAVPGTNPKLLSQGDETIVNDQLTVTHKRKGGYPIIGHDSGTCTFTRIIDSREGLVNCVATAVLPGGSLTGQGLVEMSSAGKPQPTDLAITGGTGKYASARGTLHLKNTTGYEIFKFMLQPGTSRVAPRS
jgi:Dirigent-like protein